MADVLPAMIATNTEKKRVGYMILMEREAYEKWYRDYSAHVDGETMGEAFKRRQFELEGEKVFVVDDHDHVRFSTKEEALEALSHPDYLLRGGGLLKYDPTSIAVGDRARLNPEWENAPYIAVMCIPVPNSSQTGKSFWQQHLLSPHKPA